MSNALQSRRRFLKASGLTFGFSVAGVSMQLTATQARQKGASLRVFSTSQADTLDLLADAIVPGASELGIVHFLDAQLSAPASESLLMLKYLGVAPPHNGFYTSSLDSAARAAQALYAKPLDHLSADKLEQFIDAIAADKVSQWQGPPASFFYFVLRSDAVDVVYGTPDGFEGLDIPYMPHIQPPTNW